MILPQFFQHLALLLLFLFFHPGLVDGQSKCVGSAPAAANPNNSPPTWKMTAAIQNFFFPLATNFESPRCFFFFFLDHVLAPKRKSSSSIRSGTLGGRGKVVSSCSDLRLVFVRACCFLERNSSSFFFFP